MNTSLGTKLVFAAGLLVIALLFVPVSAEACCTAVVCPYCVSSSSSCVCGSQQPVCNVFGCNCNVPCGMYTASTDLKCYFSATCDSDEAAAFAQARFGEVDADGDGKISKDEAWSWVEKQEQPVLDRVRLGEDGLAAEGAEPMAVFGAAFGHVDADGDGFVTPAEFDSGL